MTEERTQENALLVALCGVPKLLSYAPSGEHSIDIGAEVTVELGKRKAKGWVVGKKSSAHALSLLSDEQTKKEKAAPQLQLFAETKKNFLKDATFNTQAFLPEQIELFTWMADYYGVSLADVIENAIPKQSLPKPIHCVALSDDFSKKETDFKIKARAQEEVLTLLKDRSSPISLAELSAMQPSYRNAVASLKKKGLVKTFTKIPKGDFLVKPHGIFSKPAPETLTPSQQAALHTIEKALEKGSFSSSLLFGVTGSGKTEVYMRSIERVLERGGSALVIVPEIALTPQLVDQFSSRLHIPLAVLHSQVGETERWCAWQALLEGDIKVAIGARSAVFAPLKNLSLIIVDEEHESSYKQSDGLRYNGRDVAVMRAKLAGCPIILGSATPSFETLLNVKKEKFSLIEMPERVTTRPLPSLEIIDLNKIKRKEMISENISPALYNAMRETLENKGQIIILYNKRGFASFLQCDTCEEVLTCSNCSVTLTYHRNKDRLLCHYCNEIRTPPPKCPKCRDPRTTRVELDAAGNIVAKPKEIDAVGELVQRGAGTEKVVEEIALLFPEAKILRMDRDTVTKKDAYRTILTAMRSGEGDILVGTQMIAKGHDIPGVTLVGIIDADVGLHLPDFRASEKAYQLITQAAGRAGRGEHPGRVLVQTREPNHPTIVAASTNRFKAFARYELEYRKSLNYPPWGRLMRVVISSPDAQEAFEGAELTSKALKDSVEKKMNDALESELQISLLGPAPAPHVKLRGRYRWHILLKANSAKVLSSFALTLNSWKDTLKNFNDLRITVDVDPMDML